VSAPVQTPIHTHRFRRTFDAILTHGVLLIWTVVCLFPLYWTVSTSFKDQFAVLKGPRYFPWIDFAPARLGWDAVFTGQWREDVIRHSQNSLLIAGSAAAITVVLGSLAGYGLARFHYQFGVWRNKDISLWFVSQLVLPPAAVVMPILILYRELHLLDTRIGLVLLYAVVNLPIVVWIMRDQFNAIPVELEHAALVDGATIYGAFFRIVLPIALPGMVAAYILTAVFAWNEYFFAQVLSASRSVTIPLLIASQVTAQGVKWWSMAALATIAVAPLVIVGILLERFIVKGLTAGAVK
jgi:multiple sugar transport system permease protein